MVYMYGFHCPIAFVPAADGLFFQADNVHSGTLINQRFHGTTKLSVFKDVGGEYGYFFIF